MEKLTLKGWVDGALMESETFADFVNNARTNLMCETNDELTRKLFGETLNCYESTMWCAIEQDCVLTPNDAVDTAKFMSDTFNELCAQIKGE